MDGPADRRQDPGINEAVIGVLYLDYHGNLPFLYSRTSIRTLQLSFSCFSEMTVEPSSEYVAFSIWVSCEPLKTDRFFKVPRIARIIPLWKEPPRHKRNKWKGPDMALRRDNLMQT